MNDDICMPHRYARTVCVTHDAPWPGFDSGLMCSARVTARPRPGTVYAERDAYRDVLTDLIADLQPQRGSVDGCAACQDITGACPAHYGYAANRARDRAEARLREAAGTDGAALPIHRTEAGWPRCATCDGGGCHDCTDPA